MKILAIDTSALVATAALCEDTEPIAVYSQKSGLTHSRTMLPLIKNLLENTEHIIDDIDLFAVSAGPGSFTGVRIGVSTVKGLAFGKGKPCVGVSTLEAMAHTIAPFDPGSLICPVMDARRGQLYNAIFEVHGGAPIRITPDRLIDANTLAAELEAFRKPVYFTGDGYGIMERLNPPCMKTTPPVCRLQNGYGVALAALKRYQCTEDKSVFTDLLLRPEYLRPSQAEREAADLAKKSGENYKTNEF